MYVICLNAVFYVVLFKFSLFYDVFCRLLRGGRQACLPMLLLLILGLLVLPLLQEAVDEGHDAFRTAYFINT